MKRLLLLSNSTNPGEGHLEYATSAIIDFLGDTINRVLFIPYAGVGISYDEYTQKVGLAFDQMGYKVSGIHTFEDPARAVEEASAVAVGGGNTFELLNQLYQNELLDILRDSVRNGMPLMGWSAGSNIAGPTIKTTNDMPIVSPKSFEALNLVPFQINPHYTEGRIPNHGGESRPDRLNEFTALNPQVKVVAIPEGNMLRVEGEILKLIGPDEISVFEKDQPITRFNQTSDLNFLL